MSEETEVPLTEEMREIPWEHGLWLYKRDSKGRIRRWKSKATEALPEEPTGWYYESCSGIMHGAVKVTRNKQVESTSLSSHQVALSKVESTYKKKLKDGHFLSEEEAEVYVPRKPMLLHKYEEHKEKLQFPCFVLPKLDGVCCTYRDDEVTMCSREDNEFVKLKYMAEGIKKEIVINNGSHEYFSIHMVGELYAHGHVVSEIVEAIKGSNQEVLDKIRYYVFDYLPTERDFLKATRYFERLKIGKDVTHWRIPSKYMTPIKIAVAYSHEDIQKAHGAFLKQGFEGTVCCNINGLYKWDTRSYDKLKKKNLISEEFEITGFTSEMIGSDEAIVFVCKARSGSSFSVRPKWSHERRIHAMSEDARKFIGKKLTVEYRSTTAYGIPFHPVGITVRDYE